MPNILEQDRKKRVFNVGVAYQGEYVEFRHRNSSYGTFLGIVPVMIQEIDPSKAPIAIELDEVPGAKATVAYRWDGASFWRPMLIEDDKTPVDVDLFERRAQERVRRDRSLPRYDEVKSGRVWLDWPFPRRTNKIDSNVSYQDPFSLPVKDEWHDKWRGDDLAEVAGTAQANADDMAIIGGIVHLRSPEPFLAITDYNHLRIYPALPRRPHKEGATDRRTTSARLDRYDAIVEVVGAWQRPYRDKKEVLPKDSIRILIPECLKRDDLDIAARQLFGPTVAHLQNGIGNLASTDAIRLFCDLRDAAASYRAGDTSVVETGLDIVKAIHQTGMAKYDEKVYPAPDRGWIADQVAAHDILIRPLLAEHDPLATFRI